MENATLLTYIRYLVGDGHSKLERLFALLDPRIFKATDQASIFVVRNNGGESIGGVGGSTPTQTLSLDINNTSLEIGAMALLVASLLRLFAQGNAQNTSSSGFASLRLSTSSLVSDLLTDNQNAVESIQFAKDHLPKLKECLLDLLPSLFFGKNQNKELETLMGRLYHCLRNFDPKRLPSSTGSYIGSIGNQDTNGSFSSPDNSPRAWSPKAPPRINPVLWH